MSISERTVDRDLVERVAQGYKDQGYEVAIEPAATDLPDFLRDYRPDIIARNDNEHIVVEIKDPVIDADQSRLSTLARRLENRPGWKLVYISPASADPLFFDAAPRRFEADRIRAVLTESITLKESNHLEGALMLCWSALEAAMWRLAQQYELEIRRRDPLTLMRDLVSNGLISRELYQQLGELYRVRSAFAHGFEPPKTFDIVRSLDTLVEATREILDSATELVHPTA